MNHSMNIFLNYVGKWSGESWIVIRNSVSNCCVIPECVAGVSIGAISNKPNLVIQQEK